MLNPAQRLTPGTELNDGWVVTEAIQPQEGDTGGCFSERYRVTKDGKSEIGSGLTFGCFDCVILVPGFDIGDFSCIKS